MIAAGSRLDEQFALGIKELGDLRAQARKDQRGALKGAAQQFEALFMQMIMKSMRQASTGDGLFDNDQSKLYTSLFDQQLSLRLAGKGQGIGLARMLEKQLERTLPADASDPGEILENLPLQREALPFPLMSDRSFALPSMDQGVPSAVAADIAAQIRKQAVSAAPPVGRQAAADFITRHRQAALGVERDAGIPSQFVLAQAALESGWGQHELKMPDGSSSHNLFNIKAGRGWAGPSVEKTVSEFVGGREVKRTERFRAYPDYEAAFADYARFLQDNPRYSAVLGTQDAESFAAGMAQAGYATDPRYADKLARVINSPALARLG